MNKDKKKKLYDYLVREVSIVDMGANLEIFRTKALEFDKDLDNEQIDAVLNQIKEKSMTPEEIAEMQERNKALEAENNQFKKTADDDEKVKDKKKSEDADKEAAAKKKTEEEQAEKTKSLEVQIEKTKSLEQEVERLKGLETAREDAALTERFKSLGPLELEDVDRLKALAKADSVLFEDVFKQLTKAVNVIKNKGMLQTEGTDTSLDDGDADKVSIIETEINKSMTANPGMTAGAAERLLMSSRPDLYED